MNFWKVYDIAMPKNICDFEFENKGRDNDFASGGAMFIRKSVAYDMRM